MKAKITKSQVYRIVKVQMMLNSQEYLKEPGTISLQLLYNGLWILLKKNPKDYNHDQRVLFADWIIRGFFKASRQGGIGDLRLFSDCKV